MSALGNIVLAPFRAAIGESTKATMGGMIGAMSGSEIVPPEHNLSEEEIKKQKELEEYNRSRSEYKKGKATLPGRSATLLSSGGGAPAAGGNKTGTGSILTGTN